MVASLIYSEERCWKLDLVREIFTVADASLVTSIYLSKQIISDKLIWKHSVNGMFTVKSAYFVAKQVLGKMVHPNFNKINAWKIIWIANVSPKVKFFICRMMQGILPIGVSLVRKGIQTGNSYPI